KKNLFENTRNPSVRCAGTPTPGAHRGGQSTTTFRSSQKPKREPLSRGRLPQPIGVTKRSMVVTDNNLAAVLRTLNDAERAAVDGLLRPAATHSDSEALRALRSETLRKLRWRNAWLNTL